MSIADKLQIIAENEQKVFEAGKKSQYDEFWDKYQNYGNATAAYLFSGKSWTNETFKPKYSIGGKTTSYDHVFAACAVTGDLVEILKERGLEFITTGLVWGKEMFYKSKFSRIGIIDLSLCESCTQFIQESNIQIIDKVIVSETTMLASTTFRYGYALKNITFEGVIAKNLNFQESTSLTKASITSIINTLSTTTSGLTVTLSRSAVNKAFETSTGANNGSASNEWTTLIATKSNWNISLV